jgi:hypothetical protein
MLDRGTLFWDDMLLIVDHANCTDMLMVFWICSLLQFCRRTAWKHMWRWSMWRCKEGNNRRENGGHWLYANHQAFEGDGHPDARLHSSAGCKSLWLVLVATESVAMFRNRSHAHRALQKNVFIRLSNPMNITSKPTHIVFIRRSKPTNMSTNVTPMNLFEHIHRYWWIYPIISVGDRWMMHVMRLGVRV